ncbi:nuclear transport factor 2 family protein [Mycobacterium sp. 852002-51163_SCH5372311]|uniref:nuclear transport factor 2 family protein n=1 Tax=Mycobacterium sp. 852002-51163_SCH5372311 TaxID=1834097 RepID=UPI000A7CC377|nr:nuclear transport factor 2 family protein [Mycobacterium sp. 852002-51163_SCH5372311]
MVDGSLIGRQWKHMDLSLAVPHSELEALSRRYAAAVDRRDRAALLAVFTPDATLRVERPGREPSVMTGHDEIERVIAIVSRWPRTAHLVAQGLFVVEGASAVGEVYCTANHFGGGETQPGRNHVMHIRYLDRYLLGGDGRWRIVQRTVAVDATEDRPVGERIR